MSNVKDTARYAGFWLRLIAFIIDLVITGVILTPLWVWYYSGLFGPESGLYVLAYGMYVSLICGLVHFLYCVGFWTWRGQTPGKMAVRIRIIRTSGAPLGFGRAALRYLGYIVCFYTIYIGFIVVAFHKQKKGLHDIIAGTCVVVKARGSDIA